MKRRALLAVLPTILLPSPAFSATPWSASILRGGLTDGRHLLGFRLKLLPGWKTYWRIPGEAGVPPEISATGGNLESVDVFHPLPVRIQDEAGETIGYHDEVVFPITVTARDPAAPVTLSVEAFFGVCQKICIPAVHKATLSLTPADSAPDAVAIAVWQGRVPQTTTDLVTAAAAREEGGRPVLVLTLSRPVQDIFVETPANIYFRAPAFSADGLSATLTADNVASASELTGLALRITLDESGMGLEQAISVG
jgi:DsbC/DsbD-like thiol-disulfide interchange protein